MTIVKRIVLTLVLIALVLSAVNACALWQIHRSQERLLYLQSKVLPSFKDLDAAKGAVADMRVFGYRHLVLSDPQAKAQLDKVIEGAVGRFDAALRDYEQNDIKDEDDRKMLAADRAGMQAYRTALVPFYAASNANDIEAARQVLSPGGALDKGAAQLRQAINDHVDYNTKIAGLQVADNTEAYHWAVANVVGGSIVAAIAAFVFGGLLCRVVRRGLEGMRASIEQVNESLDLSVRAPVARMDEIGHAATAFNQLLGRIREAMTLVQQSTSAVSTASRQIASGNADLSGRTAQQAASLEETASSMTELTVTVRQNADHAREANTLALEANDVAEAGATVVDRLVHTMEDLHGGSAKIAEITALIEGIAFQTNILALNAAVEAARAGEQGRGFAVVAGEVRSLAQRSSAAAKEIKGLIDDSVASVREGSVQATQAGQTMSDVKRAIRRVNDLIGEIASASDEQSRGIEQVNEAINQMEGVTQQNAALVEQAAAASHSLEEQAMMLDGAVGAFRVEGGEVNRGETRAVSWGQPRLAIA
ncbi:HAMP domain-containing protein [Cupriavidus pauculus]|uniref:HAMP domain-containing protein n=1 Tax=Cupriavidus pauculus TaxID=82633 RepID=A0A5P2H316_9BURK|nr:methyl-accepting chemotaxis protein [Cupriavidus pauculus]QET02108.1 HAMP domain-containing protein [Cupriavidus pauculus]